MAQQDSISVIPDKCYHFDDDIVDGLPIIRSEGLYELNPTLVGLFSPLAYYSDGFQITNDFTWMNGFPVRFVEEMPIRMLSRMSFSSEDDYFKHGNSLSGFCTMETVSAADSVIFVIDGNMSMVRKQTNDYDLQLMVSGPLRFGKKKSNGVKSSGILSARLFSSKDPSPSYILRKEITEDYRHYLSDEPLRSDGLGLGTYANALFTHPEDATGTYFESNARKDGYYLFGNLHVQFGNGMNIKAGSHFMSKKEHLPVYGNFFFNQDENPDRATTYSNSFLSLGQEGKFARQARFHYELQGQYIYQKIKTQNAKHQDDFFRYGYVGRFDTYKRPFFELGEAYVNGQYYPEVWLLNSWDYDYLVDYTPGGVNPNVAAYTTSYYDIYQDHPESHYSNIDQILLHGGLVNGSSPQSVYYIPGRTAGLWNNLGTVNNLYSIEDERKWRILAEEGLAFGNHEISLGGYFERTSYSGYSLAPVRLWRLMHALTNIHLYSLDTDHPMLHTGEELDTVFYYRNYEGLVQRHFDRMLRDQLGLDVEGIEFIDIHSFDYHNNTISYYDANGVRRNLTLDADLFSLDMFTPDELYSLSALDCYGYDHTGRRLKEKVSLEDFFNDMDDHGNVFGEVGAYTPLNYAAYMSYRFSARVMILNAGLKMDAFDANQMVLKDPYMVIHQGQTLSIQDFTDYPTQWNLLPYLALRIRTTDWAYIDAGYNSSVRYPEPDLIFSNPALLVNYMETNHYLGLYDSKDCLPNGLLKPERADKLSVNVSFLPVDRMILKGGFFTHWYSNLLYPLPEEPYQSLTIFGNRDDAAFHYGFDGSLVFRSRKSSGFNFGLTYHNVNTKDEKFKEMHQFRVPKHVAKGYIVFNTGFGQDYIGPKGNAGYGVLSGIGVSIMSQYRSGIFYQDAADHDEDLPSYAALPSSFTLDLKLEKGFQFNEDGYSLNFYITIQNLFDSRVIFKVYPQTGEPDDDGYLSDPASQQFISDQLDSDAFRFLYSNYVNNPGHYGLPRRVYFGVQFRFM